MGGIPDFTDDLAEECIDDLPVERIDALAEDCIDDLAGYRIEDFTEDRIDDLAEDCIEPLIEPLTDPRPPLLLWLWKLLLLLLFSAEDLTDCLILSLIPLRLLRFGGPVSSKAPKLSSAT
jgi:hypothetical protein